MSVTAVKEQPNIKSVAEPLVEPEKIEVKQKPKTFARKTYIEVMRIIAAFLVIVNHTNSDVFLKMTEPQSPIWYISLTYFYVSKIAVPVFFMIMGGLLLQKVDKPKKSVERVLRMVLVTLIYSIAYYVKGYWSNPSGMSISEFTKRIFTFRATNAYWYIYAYIGLLILLPIMQRMAQAFSKRTTMYFVVLSMGVMGFIPMMDLFFKMKPHHFLTDMFFPVHLGVVFMGYYIEKYMVINKKVFFTAIFSFAFLIAFQVVATDAFYNKNSEQYLQLDNWQFLTVTLSALCFYIIFKYISTVYKTKEGVAKVLCYIGSLTFGIYLISDMIINSTKELYANLQLDCSIMVATILWEVIVFAICGGITAILKFIPGLKKLL